MKIPTFTKIEINEISQKSSKDTSKYISNNTKEEIFKILDKKDLSLKPMYIEITQSSFNDNHNDSQIITNYIYEYFIKYEISFVLPYPFFIVNLTNKSIETKLPIVNSLRDLPSHFKQNSKNLTVREKEMLKKIKILKEQVKYISNDVLRSTDQLLLRDISKLKKQVEFLKEVNNLE